MSTESDIICVGTGLQDLAQTALSIFSLQTVGSQLLEGKYFIKAEEETFLNVFFWQKFIWYKGSENIMLTIMRGYGVYISDSLGQSTVVYGLL